WRPGKSSDQARSPPSSRRSKRTVTLSGIIRLFPCWTSWYHTHCPDRRQGSPPCRRPQPRIGASTKVITLAATTTVTPAAGNVGGRSHCLLQRGSFGRDIKPFAEGLRVGRVFEAVANERRAVGDGAEQIERADPAFEEVHDVLLLAPAVPHRR